MSQGIFILQRVIPDYRVPLFRELHKTYGIKVIAAANPLRASFLKIVDPASCEFAVAAPYHYPNPKNDFRVDVPIDWILRNLRPRGLLAEFGMKMSSSYLLPLARRAGYLPRLGFWTHGWQMERGFRNPSDCAVQYGRVPLMACTDVIATYTREGARWVNRHLPFKPVIPLGNTVDSTPILDASKSANPMKNGRPQLLAIGRLTADKRFDLLFEVFDQVQRSLPSAALTLIGDGPERSKLERLAGNRLGESIIMTGAIHDENELAPHFLGADLLVVCGAAGLSINHALSYGLPVIAFSRHPAGPRHHPEIEYVVPGKTGILVNTPTSKAMSDAIIESTWSHDLHDLKAGLATREVVPTISDVVGNFGKVFEFLN